MNKETLQKLDLFKSEIKDFKHTIGDVNDFIIHNNEIIEFFYSSKTGIKFSLKNINGKIYIKWFNREFLYPYADLENNKPVHKILLSKNIGWEYAAEMLEFLVNSLTIFDKENISIPHIEKINLFTDIHNLISELDRHKKTKNIQTTISNFMKYI